jgi:choline dehydrogenase-like flavoprotein
MSKFQELAAASILTPDTHHAPEDTVARQLGGTSNLWGGRCVPYDSIDFTARPWLGIDSWPIAKTDLDPYLPAATAALDAGPAVYTDPIGTLDIDTAAFRTDRLERWSGQPRTHLKHMARLKGDCSPWVALRVTVTDLLRGEGERINGVQLTIDGDATPRELHSEEVIVAGGGLASTQLLLNVQAQCPSLFGGEDGPLGKYYMGHLNGQIADIVFTSSALQDKLGFYTDAAETYVRRRIYPTEELQERERIANTVFWPVVPEIANPAHRSGALSAVFLGLTLPILGPRLIPETIRQRHVGYPPYRRMPHIRNIIADPVSVIGFIPTFLWKRYVEIPRVPGLFLRNAGRRYGLEFHNEHLPSSESRVRLMSEADRNGLRRIEIDFRFSEQDVESVIRSHELLEDWLRHNNLGRLEYRMRQEKRADGVRREARHGNHQIGTIRMGRTRDDGVVDEFGTSFDFANLHVTSTAILPTSSQANPTLTAMQLALRLVDRLTRDGHD